MITSSRKKDVQNVNIIHNISAVICKVRKLYEKMFKKSRCQKHLLMHLSILKAL